MPNFFGSIDVGSNCVPSIADLDMDGDADIVTGNLSGDIQFFENMGTTWVENPAPVAGLSVDQNATPALADLDADGDYDLTLGQYTGTFDYYKNNAIISASGEKHQNPFELCLSAFPNPFSQSTTLQFNLMSATDVSLQVTDIRGRVIISEKFRNMRPGNHAWRLNIGTHPPGVYIIRLVAGNYQETIKTIVGR